MHHQRLFGLGHAILHCSWFINTLLLLQCLDHFGMLRKMLLLLEGVGLALAQLLMDGAADGAVSGELLSNCTLR